jgi:hypothetical protein
VKRFAEGDRVFVRDWLGREHAATVAADFAGAGLVSVVLIGKSKPVQRAADRIRLQPELRVVEGGAYRTPARCAAPAVESTAAESLQAASPERPRPWAPPPVAAPPPIPQPRPGTVVSRAAVAPVELRAVPKPALPDRDPRFLAFVREHACCGCDSSGDVDAHHWARRGQKGLATKPSDFSTVPLCRRCHDMWHTTGELPRMNGPQSKFWFLAKQVDLLIAWVHELSAPRRSRKERRA